MMTLQAMSWVISPIAIICGELDGDWRYNLWWRCFAGDGGGLANVAAAIASDLSKAQFSRTQEAQADEFGLQLLVSHYGARSRRSRLFPAISATISFRYCFVIDSSGTSDRSLTLTQPIAQRRYPIKERSPLPATLKTDR